MICGLPGELVGAEPCPREPGHPGPCYFWVPIQRGLEWIEVVVYVDLGDYHRKKLCKGQFLAWPDGEDVQALIQTIVRGRRREKAEAAAARANPTPVLPDLVDAGREDTVGAGIGGKSVTKPTESRAARAARAMARSVQHGHV